MRKYNEAIYYCESTPIKTQFMPFVKFQFKNNDAGDIEGLNAAVKGDGA